MDYQVTTFQFVNCKHPNENITVSGSAAISLSPIDNGQNSYLVAYDNYTINATGMDALTINGAMRRPEQPQCGVDNARTV